MPKFYEKLKTLLSRLVSRRCYPVKIELERRAGQVVTSALSDHKGIVMVYQSEPPKDVGGDYLEKRIYYLPTGRYSIEHLAFARREPFSWKEVVEVHKDGTYTIHRNESIVFLKMAV